MIPKVERSKATTMIQIRTQYYRWKLNGTQKQFVFVLQPHSNCPKESQEATGENESFKNAFAKSLCSKPQLVLTFVSFSHF